MNLSAISNKTLFGKLLRFPLRLIPNGLVLPILQGRLKGKKWIVGSSNHGCWLGSYEYEKRLVFEKIVTEGSVVFDIGAHVGFYTLLAAEIVGPEGEVFAFEPVPRNLYYLEKHLQLNHITNVSVVEAAVSDCSEVVFFAEGLDSSTGYIAQSGVLEVKAINLDASILNGELFVPDYIKIDVEGAERAVLSGARRTLESYYPVIFLATHGDEVKQGCCELLQNLGYKLRAIDGESIEEARELLAYT